MAKCLKLCFSCLKIFKPTRVTNEVTEFNNSCAYKNSCYNLSDSKQGLSPQNTEKKPVSPIRSTIITGKNMNSARLGTNFYLPSEDSSDLSSISHKSNLDSLGSFKIPSPPPKKSSKIVPVIFSPRPEGKMPKLYLAVPRKKYPRSKSIQVQGMGSNLCGEEEPKFKE